MAADIFVSYASRDRARVVELVRHLEAAGLTVWRDQNEILGGENYGPRIVQGIRECQVLLLVCSTASMRSKNVKQEIQLAWHHGRPYLPLLIEPMTEYPVQVAYWLSGCQWVKVMDWPAERWLPQVRAGLAAAGVPVGSVPPASPPAPSVSGLAELRALAKFTDQLWPVPADKSHRSGPVFRDLGAPQDDVQYDFRKGDRVSVAVETDRPGHLLLLDEGTSGKVYCLCPSKFAPDTRLPVGRAYLPQPGSPHPAFAVSGPPGREHLLAVISDAPLALDWMPAPGEKSPARVLTPADIKRLLTELRSREPNAWTALATYFEVVG